MLLSKYSEFRFDLPKTNIAFGFSIITLLAHFGKEDHTHYCQLQC